MPCDIPLNRRRVRWEYLNRENARCKAQIGFALDGTMAREYWCQFLQEQTNPDWEWLNGGFVLHDTTALNPDDTGWFIWDEVPAAFNVTLAYRGSNIASGEPGFPISLDARLVIERPVAINPAVYIARRTALAPANNFNWSFDQFEEATSTGLVPPEGVAAVWPLRACHTCVGNQP